ncbi:hypothetical protein Syn7502_02242 [Synechococcus sp. PCC 7502]|uniref:hypothetical protein n=1 Tax=Synechococcus sp. PCC 7502 TaxID=1173263 RepID=UPI00029FD68F|nr:hypothetical protein [Synechococcus sp. PCC 7502]AFY74250.1 hypothetical protein Syn7502_02242 [Synechococcus sp. PCC 7502]
MKHFFLVLLALIYLAFPIHDQAIAAINSGFATNQEPSQELVQRLEKIKATMAKIRFCYNENCFYRNITSTIKPPSNALVPYSATISATIDRPSTVLDTADYTLNFINHRWQLVKGEEYTDVAEYLFNGDRYEIFSVHSNRSIKGKLEQARKDSNLKSGYLTMYYDIFDNGIEKVKP